MRDIVPLGKQQVTFSNSSVPYIENKAIYVLLSCSNTCQIQDHLETPPIPTPVKTSCSVTASKPCSQAPPQLFVAYSWGGAWEQGYEKLGGGGWERGYEKLGGGGWERGYEKLGGGGGRLGTRL